MLNQSSPVAKTAFDALQAKQSAVSVGYDPIVVQNQDVYKTLLESAVSSADWNTRRQTPLVNAGYAARVLAISHAIHGFVTYHCEVRQCQKVQLVLLGCGADVIALWAHSLAPSQMTVLEFDTPEVCCIKRDLWIQKGLVHPTATASLSSSEEEKSGKLVGCIPTRRSDGSDDTSTAVSSSEPTYGLFPVDLRDISQLNQVLLEHAIDTSLPTLVVSELVLAYLAPQETDDLLAWCSSHLCKTPGSAIVALEPLGHDDASSSSNNVIISVMEGYKREYCQQFGSKMVRGKSLHGKVVDEQSATTTFHPIAVSHDSASERCRIAGFQQVHAVDLGTATAHAVAVPPRTTFAVPEIFDEHAALAFHLKSYTLICGFVANNNDTDDTEEVLLLRRLMCPSQFAATEIPPLVTPEVTFTVIEATDDNLVKDVFYNTYEHLFGLYPAIRKMMSGVMKSDLSISSSNNNTEQHAYASAIGNYYKARSGCFLVAIRYDQETGKRQLVGCIGVRQCERKDLPKTLEVFRLAVDKDYRGKGIGRTLATMAEQFALSQGSPKLIANTLTILESAMRLYEALGYKHEKDTTIGTLVMRTYVKELDSGE